MRLLLCALLAIIMPVSATAEPGFDIILNFGQSNSKQPGRGVQADPYQSVSVDCRIYQLGRYETALQIYHAGCPSDPDYCATGDRLRHWNTDSQCTPEGGRGIGMPFARRYVVNSLSAGRDVLIIPGGRGSSSTMEWMGEIIKHPEGPLLYSDLIGRAKYALSLPGSRVVAAIVALGEGDVNLCDTGQTTAAAFRDRLRYGIIAGLRADLPHSPPFPVTWQKFAPSWNLTQCKAEIEAEIQTAKNYDGMFDVVWTTGLQSNAEAGYGASTVHFSAQSMVTLADRHYQRHQELIARWSSGWRPKRWGDPRR